MKRKNSLNKRKAFLDFNFILIHLFIFLFFPNKTYEDTNCERETPIKRFGQCVIEYCTKEQFNSNYCQINNEIIKTQWLNNLINIEISYSRYVNFASYSNGDMILQSGTYPSSKKRNFIGFKKNGRSFFIDKQTNKPTYYYSFEVSQGTNYEKFESENFVIKMNNNDIIEEYLFSISKVMSYVEIYDFQNDKIYQKVLSNFANNTNITSYQHVIIPLFTITSDFSYLFGFIKNDAINPYTFIFQKHTFNTIDNFQTEKTIVSSKIYKRSISNDQTGFSCFLTEKNNIICFFLTFDTQYIITAFDIDLNEIKYITLPYTSVYFKETFYKCINLKNGIGVFSYYKHFTYQNPEYYPVIVFKQYQETETDIDIVNYELSEIIINKINILFDPFILLNDLIKVNENKLCFCSTNLGKDNLYIIIINLLGGLKYKVRYYIINLYHLYGYSVHLQLKAYIYNNFISLAFSFSSQYIQKCNNGQDYDKVCSTLLIISYANSTDSELILDEYLHNNVAITDIEVNLENEVRIENNIFGYEFLGIEIKDLVNCENLIIMTTLYNKNIYLNYTLQKNEIIKLKFSGNDYKSFICNLQYSYKVTESDLDVYNLYPNIIDESTGTNENTNFTKEKYTGKLTYFDIKLNEDLTTNCNDNPNCAYCFESNKNVCLE